jgi:hypothetical protein
MAGELSPLDLVSSAGLVGQPAAAGSDLLAGCRLTAVEQQSINHGDRRLVRHIDGTDPS